MDVYCLISEADYQRLMSSSKTPIKTQTQTLYHTDQAGLVSEPPTQSKQTLDTKEDQSNKQGEERQLDDFDQVGLGVDNSLQTSQQVVDTGNWSQHWENLFFSK